MHESNRAGYRFMLHPAVKSCCAVTGSLGKNVLIRLLIWRLFRNVRPSRSRRAEGGGWSFSGRYRITEMRWNCSVMDWMVQGAGIGNRWGRGREQIAPLQYDILRHKAWVRRETPKEILNSAWKFGASFYLLAFIIELQRLLWRLKMIIKCLKLPKVLILITNWR